MEDHLLYLLATYGLLKRYEDQITDLGPNKLKYITYTVFINAVHTIKYITSCIVVLHIGPGRFASIGLPSQAEGLRLGAYAYPHRRQKTLAGSKEDQKWYYFGFES